MRVALRWLVLAGLVGLGRTLPAGEATIPGEVSTPYPTMTNLAVVWEIQGDDNHNGRVTVRYRRVDEQAWHEALPLRRVPAGQSRNTRPIFTWKNKHAGSLFDLAPDTEYDIELTLTDPDGGSAERLVRARTRPVPRVAADAVIRPVTPAGLAEAARQAGPGDVLLLAPGEYGPFTVTRDGRAGRPLVLRAEQEGTARFNGISLRNRRHVFLEGLACTGDRIDLSGAEECVVRRCTVNHQFGIVAYTPGATHCYIADNVVTGEVSWTPEAMGAAGRNRGYGIQLTGPGNVVCHNRVSGFRDCISFLEDQDVHEQVCIDVYNNDIYNAGDDGIEADFAMHNCRIVRNRLTNCFVGISSQPGLGGPNYFIRNAQYNILHTPFKLQRDSVGDVVLHNTVVKIGDGVILFSPVSHTLFRNNLFIGGRGGGRINNLPLGSGRAADLRSPDGTCDFDYDGFGTFETPFAVKIGPQHCSSIDVLRRTTTEKHAVQVDLGSFQDVAFPDPPFPERTPPDLRLRPGSAAIDAGAHLPNINDGYRGQAPDLGAYELGQEPVHYGPRPSSRD